jgi:hypothetical protein
MLRQAVCVVLAGGMSTLGACASTTPLQLHDAVGPAHLHVQADPAPQGHLMVYSVSYVGSEDADIERLVHSSYEIYAPDGQLVRSVDNQSGLYGSEPTLESLPPGRYQVTADAYRVGRVSVPVVVELNRTTVVDLNEDLWSDRTVADNAVRLPNGAVIGSRADP